ncbi:MAG: cytochrome c peroxidase, partial [Actinomycetota bacterium]
DSQVQSVGHTGETTRRHSMTLVNLRYRPGGRMFWDGRAVSVEMGMTLEELTERLADTDYYPPLFEAAFGDAEITSERIAQAVAQFVRSIVSFETRFDEAVAEVGDVRGDFPGYTDQEQLGKEIFFGEGEHNQGLGGNCSTCHMYANPAGFLPPEGAPGAAPPGAPDPENTGFFFLIRPNNNGLLDPDDDGFGETTEAEADDGKFFVSSLRNVALTAPYMHDGRFATLEEVIDHYSEGVEPHPNLDPQLFDFSAAQPLTTPLQYGFTDEEKAAVIAYLGTLTDESVLTDERWSDPFGQ